MKVALGLLLLTVAVAYATETSPLEKGVYGYHRRFGIPQALRIKKFEDEILSGRVAGGSTATPLSVPYQAGLLMVVGFTTSICGGSILNENTIISAAHCYNDGSIIPAIITIVIGSPLLFTGGQRYNNVVVTSHPDYNPITVLNDIALFRTQTPMTLSITAQAIPLPLSTSEISSNYTGSTATASGYGITNDGESIGLLQTMSSVELRVISNEECASFYPNYIHNTHMCTSGDGGVGICGGDTGGPLVVRTSPLRRFLIGISSFISSQGCQAGFPAGYTRITSFLGWIANN